MSVVQATRAARAFRSTSQIYKSLRSAIAYGQRFVNVTRIDLLKLAIALGLLSASSAAPIAVAGLLFAGIALARREFVSRKDAEGADIRRMGSDRVSAKYQ